MKKFLVDFFKNLAYRLSSRKFVLTLSSIYIFYVNKQWNLILAAVLGFTGAEGVGDAIEKYSKVKNSIDDDDPVQAIQNAIAAANEVDKTQFVVGDPIGMSGR